MLRTSCAGGVLALLMFQLGALAAPSILIKSAVSANKTAGNRVLAGDPIKTGKSGVVAGDFSWGGVKSFSILPSSALELDTFGNRAKGGRFTQLNVSGEVFIEVLTVNPATEVKVCFKNRFGRSGCSRLKSSVRIAPVSDGGQLVGVLEGNVQVQDEMEFTPMVQLVSGQYSILGKDGKFTPAMSVRASKGYSLGIGRSKTIGVFEVAPGWRFCDGSESLSAAIGTPLCVLSPLVNH